MSPTRAILSALLLTYCLAFSPQVWSNPDDDTPPSNSSGSGRPFSRNMSDASSASPLEIPEDDSVSARGSGGSGEIAVPSPLDDGRRSPIPADGFFPGLQIVTARFLEFTHRLAFILLPDVINPNDRHQVFNLENNPVTGAGFRATMHTQLREIADAFEAAYTTGLPRERRPLHLPDAPHAGGFNTTPRPILLPLTQVPTPGNAPLAAVRRERANEIVDRFQALEQAFQEYARRLQIHPGEMPDEAAAGVPAFIAGVNQRFHTIRDTFRNMRDTVVRPLFGATDTRPLSRTSSRLSGGSSSSLSSGQTTLDAFMRARPTGAAAGSEDSAASASSDAPRPRLKRARHEEAIEVDGMDDAAAAPERPAPAAPLSAFAQMMATRGVPTATSSTKKTQAKTPASSRSGRSSGSKSSGASTASAATPKLSHFWNAPRPAAAIAVGDGTGGTMGGAGGAGRGLMGTHDMPIDVDAEGTIPPAPRATIILRPTVRPATRIPLSPVRPGTNQQQEAAAADKQSPARAARDGKENEDATTEVPAQLAQAAQNNRPAAAAQDVRQDIRLEGRQEARPHHDARVHIAREPRTPQEQRLDRAARLGGSPARRNLESLFGPGGSRGFGSGGGGFLR